MEFKQITNINFAKYAHFYETQTNEEDRETAVKGECVDGSMLYKYSFTLCDTSTNKPFVYLIGLEVGLHPMYEDASEDQQAFAAVYCPERLTDGHAKALEEFITQNYSLQDSEFIRNSYTTEN